MKMNREIKKVTLETDQYVKAAEIAERLQKKNVKSLDNEEAISGVKQRLTEAEIMKKKAEKKMKNNKFKAKLQKSKLKKLEKKIVKNKQKRDDAKSLNLFTEKYCFCFIDSFAISDSIYILTFPL